jgi:hypothetical protein
MGGWMDPLPCRLNHCAAPSRLLKAARGLLDVPCSKGFCYVLREVGQNHVCSGAADAEQ